MYFQGGPSGYPTPTPARCPAGSKKKYHGSPLSTALLAACSANTASRPRTKDDLRNRRAGRHSASAADDSPKGRAGNRSTRGGKVAAAERKEHHAGARRRATR